MRATVPWITAPTSISAISPNPFDAVARATPARDRKCAGAATPASIGHSAAVRRGGGLALGDRDEGDLARFHHAEAFPRQALEGPRVVQVLEPGLEICVLTFEDGRPALKLGQLRP